MPKNSPLVETGSFYCYACKGMRTITDKLVIKVVKANINTAYEYKDSLGFCSKEEEILWVLDRI